MSYVPFPVKINKNAQMLFFKRYMYEQNTVFTGNTRSYLHISTLLKFWLNYIIEKKLYISHFLNESKNEVLDTEMFGRKP